MIDTCPLWDEDGRCYLVNAWANSRSRFASVITVRELNADGTEAVSAPVIVLMVMARKIARVKALSSISEMAGIGL